MKRRIYKFKVLIITLIVVMTMTTSIYLAIDAQNNVEETVRLRLDEKTETIKNILEFELIEIKDLVYFIQSYYYADYEVTGQELDDYVSPIIKNMESVEMLGWAPFVHKSKLSDFYKYYHRDVCSDCYGDLKREIPKIAKWNYADYYVPLINLVPCNEFEDLYGLDLLNNKIMRSELTRALEKGSFVTSKSKNILVGERQSFVITNPIYMSSKRKQLKGYILLSISYTKFIEHALNDITNKNIIVELREIDDLNNYRSLATFDHHLPSGNSSISSIEDMPLFEEYSSQRSFTFNEHSYQIRTSISKEFLSSYNFGLPKLWIIAGIITTLVLSLLVILYFSRTEKIEDLVYEKTREFRENQKRYHDILMTASDWIWEINPKGEYTFASGNVENILGYKQEEIIGKSPFDFIIDENIEEIKKKIEEIIYNRQPIVDLENWNRTKDGKKVCLLTNAVPFFDEMKVLKGYRGLDKDITEKKRAEKQVELTEKRLLSVQENILIGIYRSTPKGKLLYVNNVMAKMFGFESAEELLKIKDTSILYANSSTRSEIVQEQLKVKAEDNTGELEMKKITGETFWVSYSEKVITDDEGNVKYFDGTMEDITERKKMELALNESEKRFRTILESVQIGLMIIDPDDHKIVYINKVGMDLTGYNEDEAINQKCFDIVCASEKDNCPLKANKNVNNKETVMICKDSKEIPILKTATTIFINDKEHYLESFVDISRLKETQKSLKISKQMTEKINKLIQLQFDPNKLEKVLDIAFDEIINTRFLNLMPQGGIFISNEDNSKFSLVVSKNLSDEVIEKCSEVPVGQCLCGRAALQNELLFCSGQTDDNNSHCELKNSEEHGHYNIPISDEGKVIGVIVLYLYKGHKSQPREIEFLQTVAQLIGNIIQHKKTQIDLNLKSWAIETAANSIVITDDEGSIIYVNKAFEGMSGFKKDEVISLSALTLKEYNEGNNKFEEMWSEVFKGHVWKGELRNRRKDDTYYEAEMIVTPIHDKSGQITNFVAIIQDVTDRIKAKKELESYAEDLRIAHEFQSQNSQQLQKLVYELEKSKEKAEIANEAKSNFLANMSHEIRTPMNGIIGMTNLAMDTKLTLEQREYMTLVQTSANNLLTIINDILDFSKIEAGQMTLEKISFNLQDVIEAAISPLSIKAIEKQIELIIFVSPLVPLNLIGDPTRLRQIIINLVGNAIKFTDEGEIIVKVDTVSESKEPQFHFSICDTGIGIPIEKQDSIFESFTQADGSTTRKYGGTGLGTSISKQLIELMNGKIWIESPSNKSDKGGPGTTFHFIVELGIDHDAEVKPLDNLEEIKGKRVLIVDDIETNQKYIDYKLHQWGLKTEIAENGQVALDMLAAEQGGKNPFELILLDWHMPVLDGKGFVEKYTDVNLAVKPPIIILSSSRISYTAEEMAHYSIVSHMIKPIIQEYLLKYIRNALSTEKKWVDTQKLNLKKIDNQASDKSEKIRILLAEDNKVNQVLALKLLKKRNYDVTVANNGQEAVDLYSQNEFDIVLMDVQMPVLNGYEATAKIREIQLSKVENRHLPIIAMTANAMEGDKEKCLAAGMDEYVSKPINADELFSKIESFTAMEITENNKDLV